MQAIITKYLGPTNRRGSRIKATCNTKTITVEYDDALSLDGNHEAAFRALARHLGWLEYGAWHHGTLPGNAGRVFACAGRFNAYVVPLHAAVAP